ncbi:TIGR04219 family outer membrane beta-barrel protein [Desulfonatronum thioautotrophicum]|uniref:TIGR04219 family outer membrane beta-barrel protein n=1 Tax=Desulfonatronum thioautotrophicum TaxID=617001 RepID=UPI0009FE6BA5|nr:TIGR04219 family outer membrane beta-barrel protein [Desulfonatronum thioautotrophicum]
MSRFWVALAACMLLAMPGWVGATGFEAAVGVWQQSPSGDVSYKAQTGDDRLDLESRMGLDDETGLIFRARLETPLFLPNIGFMATPTTFSGKGTATGSFRFGDQTFSGDAPIDGKLRLNQYDVSLFYGIPGLKMATMGMFNVDLGLNLRLMDVDVEVRQEQTGLSESESLFLPVPTLYAGATLRPLDFFALEAEARGVTYAGNHFYSLIGRVRFDPLDHLFLTGGYRYDSISIDEQGLKADVDISGPFVEIGISF